MVDLSRPWPLGLGEKRWWQPVVGALVVLAVAVAVDRQLSLLAQSWPDYVTGPLAEITRYGQSDWILYPSAALFIVTATLALLVRWKLMRTLLWQFAAIYAFFFFGVGVPSLVTTVVKRLIGRARPVHLEDTGPFAFHPNWADWTYQSLPSGHATTAFALAAVVGFLSPRWFYPALGLAAVIGLSRLTLGAHYPSDVVAGAIVGLIGAYAIRLVFASRGWLFRRDAAGRVITRPISSLRRYLSLRQRGNAKGPQPDRP